MKTNYYTISIRILLATTVLILGLNFACAKGTGVELLVILGQITTEQTTQKSHIIKGVYLMQWIIRVVATIGVSAFMFYLFKGWNKTKEDPLA